MLLIRAFVFTIVVATSSITIGALVWSAGASGHYGDSSTTFYGYHAALEKADNRRVWRALLE